MPGVSKAVRMFLSLQAPRYGKMKNPFSGLSLGISILFIFSGLCNAERTVTVLNGTYEAYHPSHQQQDVFLIGSS
jgi:hypothetical protein